MAAPRVDFERAGLLELLAAVRMIGRNLEREGRTLRQLARETERRLAVLETQEAGAAAGDTIGDPRRETDHDHHRHRSRAA